MAQSKVTREALVQLSQMLRTNHDDILAVKNSMDSQLGSFLWDDPVGRNFIARYYEDLKPIEGKLIPNLVDFCNYLNQQASIVDAYSG